ncbi:MAG: UPF0182 family protein [Methylococcaceae bacterium]|nr:UPF0182 family protein [Methylococcaceae bacterium]
MRNWKDLLTISAVALGALALIALALGIALTNFLVDFWWFSSLDFGGYFWLRVLYRYIFSGGVTIFFFGIFFLHFWAASRYLGVDQSAFSELTRSDGARYRNLLSLFQTGSMKVYVPLSLILAVTIAAPFYTQWEQALLFFFGPASGVMDPVYGEDVSFYLLQLPLLELIYSELLATAVILLVAVWVLYWIEHQLLPVERKEWPVGARLHLAFLIFVTAFFLAWGFLLERHNLLYVGAHEPVFFGPGFVEMRYVNPLLWMLVVWLLAAATCCIAWVYNGKAFNGMAAFLVLFFITWAMRHWQFPQQMLDRFVVKPNPVAVERDFMNNNIKATLSAYGLDQVKTIPLTATAGADLIDPHTRENLHNIPIWDPEYLDDVYQQLQGIRPYYRFTDVDVGRYSLNGVTEQVNLAAREINIGKLPKEAQNWENTHLRYTHGFGAVVTPASQKADLPMEWFLRDLNLQSSVGMTVEKPDIYFGTEQLGYAVVPNRLNIVDISSFDMDSSQNYTGRDGVPISSLFRRLLCAIYFRDEKLFFSINIDDNSKLLFRRNIVERIKTLTPFLALDRDPYIVVTPRHIYWVQDAYTTSNWYPASKPTHFTFAGVDGKEEAHKFNYIRNSVKVVVDAFDGTVDYYVSDPSDSIILGYSKAYPGVFKDIATLPPLLREQLRYPRDVFGVQMGIYAKYHQTDPALFYQQAETWDVAKVDNNPMKPYYFTTYLEGAEEMQDFVLLNAMTPVGRNNLSMIGVAGSLKAGVTGLPYSPKIAVYKFSRDVQVNGPSQVSALIDQDPEIARLFALWDQKGSHVQRGRMIMLPIGRSLLYVQPVYIVSTASTKIPELARVILSMGNIVVMDTSLEKALDRLEARLRQTIPGTNHGQPAPTDNEAIPSMRPL